MVYPNSEFLYDSTNQQLEDSQGEILLCLSDDCIIEDEITITEFVLHPTTVAINSKVNAAVKVMQELVEKPMLIWRSGDLFSGEV